MITSVPMLMLGLAIIAALGSVFGYLLEPGRFQRRGQSVNAGYVLSADERCAPKGNGDTPRWAA
jgi:hypothetical protein